MRAIVQLFQLLDRGFEPSVCLDDAVWLGCRNLNDLIDSDVLVPAPPMDCINAMCGECGDHVVIRVERPTGIEFYEVCPYDGAERIDPERLKQWSINGHAIADLLAAAMPPAGVAETLLPGKAWRIGDLQIGGEPLSIVLTTTRAAASLADRSGASRMILVGDNLPADGFAGSLSIDEAFAMSDSGIEIRSNRFRQAIPLSHVATGNAFYRKGQMWVVRYEGQETFLENNVGALYIARLLATPHRVVPAVTLLASRIGIDERKLTGSSGELADEQAVQECGERYRELMRDITEAEVNKDLGRLEALQTEKEKLTLHFASVLGRGGRHREVGDMKKVSQSVSLGIRRTLETLDRELKPLADHLNASITRGITLMYSPPVDVDWLV